jgi:hypothetical protein
MDLPVLPMKLAKELLVSRRFFMSKHYHSAKSKFWRYVDDKRDA